MASWMLNAAGVRKVDVAAALDEAMRQAEAGALEDDGAGLEPGALEQMRIGIDAATAASQLVSGKKPVDVNIAGSGHEDNVRLILTVSRGGEPAFVAIPVSDDGGDV